MRIVTLFCLVLGLFSIPLHSAEVEVYFFSKQKAFRLSGFNGTEVALTEVPTEAVSGYSGSGNDEWWVVGELPIESGKAMTLADYSTKRIARSYTDRHLPLSYSVHARVDTRGVYEETEIQNAGSFILLGWQSNGRLTRFSVAGLDRDGSATGIVFQIEEAELGGRPLAWVVSRNKIVEQSSVRSWDRALIDGTEVDPKELAKEMDARKRGSIFYAAANGDTSLVSMLLEVRKSIYKQYDQYDVSPLSAAGKNGRSEVVNLLLEAGAPLADGAGELSSIVRTVAEMGHYETLKLLASKPAVGRELKWHYSWALSTALTENYEDIALYLLNLGVEIGVAKEDRGLFALQKVELGYPELGLRLMEKFKVEQTYNKDGYNFLHSIAGYADAQLLEKVREMGVDPGQTTKVGFQPVDIAIGRGNVDSLCWFLDNGLMTSVGTRAVNPMRHAVVEGQLSSVDCLIGYGFDVNEEFTAGVNPLMLAISYRRYDIAESLVSAGALFLLDSSYMDFAAIRIVEADQVKLLNHLVDQGWTENRLIHGALTLKECIEFFDSTRCEEAFPRYGWKKENLRIRKMGEVETQPTISTNLQVDYPLDLQEKYGQRECVADICIDPLGRPILVDLKTKTLERELWGVVENSLLGMRFNPAKVGEDPVAVSMRVKVPLNAELDPTTVLSMLQVDEKPSAKRVAPPIYPYELQHKRVRGRVLVEFVLAANGTPYRLRVVESNHTAFSRAALDCVQKSDWNPAKKDGKEVACLVRIPIVFSPH